MGWFDAVNEQVSAGGQWLGDAVFAPAAPGVNQHLAADEAHTDTAGNGADNNGGLLQSIGDLGRGIQQEGLAGLLDPFGAMDRQDAQRDLASRFNVMDENSLDGQQNSVTPEQFQEIARSYSDIRMGRGHLKLDTEGMTDENAAAFRTGAMDDIADILQTDSGRGLIGELQEGALEADGVTHRDTTIGRAADVDSARGGGRWNDDDTKKTGYANYIPGENALPDSGNYRSDVTLFHELTHAYESTNNNFAPGQVRHPVHDVDTCVSDGEYQAVGLGDYEHRLYNENAYRMDRIDMQSGLRTRGGSDLDMELRQTYNVPGHHDHADD